MGDQWQLAWTSPPGIYDLQERDAFDPQSPWTMVPATPTVVGAEIQVLVPTASSFKFYRLLPKVPLDQGQTVQTLVVKVIGDTLYEPDETFFVNLSNPGNATLGQARAPRNDLE